MHMMVKWRYIVVNIKLFPLPFFLIISYEHTCLSCHFSLLPVINTRLLVLPLPFILQTDRGTDVGRWVQADRMSVTDMSSVGYGHDECRRPLPIVGSAVGRTFWKAHIVSIKACFFLSLTVQD